MKRTLSAATARRFLENQNDLEALRILYVAQIGSVFTRLSLMEHTIIRAMAICDRVKVANALGVDTPAWRRLIDKTDTLQSSTLGNLIAILSRHGLDSADLSYLKWLKARRDFFVHRLFNDVGWPDELDEVTLPWSFRSLLYLEIIFDRAAHCIWRILARANLMAMTDLGPDGVLMMNLDLFGDPYEGSAPP